MSRFEKKYSFLAPDKNEINNVLISNNFYKIHNSRVITSIYYEDQNFSLYNQSIDGLGLRNKYRIRIYNFDSNTAYFESKIRINDIGIKKASQLETYKEKTTLNLKDPLRNLETNVIIPSSIEIFYFPLLSISYDRDYFAHRYNNDFRVTLDYSISFGRILTKEKKIKFANNNFLSERDVMEIKYPASMEWCPVEISKKISHLHLQYERNSKYCNALETLF